MYNNKNAEHKSSGAPPPMSPRISFSNDFVESSQYSSSSNNNNNNSNSHHKIRGSYRDAPVSDFEFSVSGYSMMSADELFCKGRLLPLKESCSSSSSSNFQKITTIRDELLQHDDDNNGDDDDGNEGGFSLRPPKNPTKWRGFLGLKKSHVVGSKKSDKAAATAAAARAAGFNNYGDIQCSKNSQDLFD